MQPGLEHPVVLAVYSVSVATCALFAGTAFAHALTARVLPRRAVRRYLAFSLASAVQALLVALSFVPMDPAVKVHLFRLMWVCAMASVGTWMLAVHEFTGGNSPWPGRLATTLFALATIPALDLLLSVTTGASFFFVDVPRDPASLLIRATGNHYSHAWPADALGLAFTVLILAGAAILLREVVRRRPGEWVLAIGIVITAVAAGSEAVLAVALPGVMVPLLFAGNVVEAVRISWSSSRRMGARLQRAKDQDEAQRELIAHQLDQLSRTRDLAQLGSRAAELGHDLRNPLTAAVLSLSFLQERAASDKPVSKDELEEVLRIAQHSLDDVVALVERMRSVRPAEARREDVCLERVIRDAIALVTHHTLEHEVSFHVDDGGGAALIHGDRVDLTRIIVNLLTNAACATRHQEDPWIRVEALVDGPDLVVDVVDSGRTPPPSVLDEMFRRGFTTKDEGAGQGLGLAISRRIALGHGGSLDVVRHASNTTMRLRLPRVVEQTQTHSLLAEHSEALSR